MHDSLPPPPLFSGRLGIFQNAHKTKLTKVNKNKTTHERANQTLASHSHPGEEPASCTPLAHFFLNHACVRKVFSLAIRISKARPRPLLSAGVAINQSIHAPF